MSSPSPPTPPNPQATAAAQTGTNVSTAIANAALGNVNQVTPYGNITYDQSGSQSVYDPSTGTNYNVPRYTATTTLTPQQQQTLDTTQSAATDLAGAAKEQASYLKSSLATPTDLNSLDKSTQDNLDSLAKARLDPQWQQNTDQFNTQMANQGVAPGSQAYDNAYRDFTQSKNDAYNQMYLGGQSQAFGQAYQAANLPINQTTALMSGSQVTNPNPAATNMPTIPTTDYAGIVNSNFNQQEQNYQSAVSQNNALMGGMFSLAAAPLYGMKFSDRRMKTNIEKVGNVGGHGIYKFRYKSGGPMQLGMIAQEVEKKQPDAVQTDPQSGMKMVNYGKALKLGAA